MIGGGVVEPQLARGGLANQFIPMATSAGRHPCPSTKVFSFLQTGVGETTAYTSSVLAGIPSPIPCHLCPACLFCFRHFCFVWFWWFDVPSERISCLCSSLPLLFDSLLFIYFVCFCFLWPAAFVNIVWVPENSLNQNLLTLILTNITNGPSSILNVWFRCNTELLLL